jgi:hypothetical protein
MGGAAGSSNNTQAAASGANNAAQGAAASGAKNAAQGAATSAPAAAASTANGGGKVGGFLKNLFGNKRETTPSVNKRVTNSRVAGRMAGYWIEA